MMNCSCFIIGGIRFVCAYCRHIEERRNMEESRARTLAALERRIQLEMRMAEARAEARRQEEIQLAEQRRAEETSRAEAERLKRKAEEEVRKAEEAAMGMFPSKAFHSDKDTGENIDHFKGVVSIADVIEFNGSVASSRPDGYQKYWANSIDLVNVLTNEIHVGHLTFGGKRVLELSCNDGLPGIFACLKGASMVHFQDGNAENLKCITAPNVLAYLMEAQVRKSQQPESSLPLTPSRQTLDPKVNFYARDWGESPGVLSAVKNDGHEVDRGDHDYDIILLTRIPYSAASMKKLYAFIKKGIIRSPYGVVYLASTKNRKGGCSHGVLRLRKLVDEEGIFRVDLVKELAGNHIWKLLHK
ncbi:hypothetical protein QL285_083364 [Trifolium repens]|nr:hypothetical protein QL285_083364 [Trifolium repens]